MRYDFPIGPDELDLRFQNPDGARMLSFANGALPYAEWRAKAAAKLVELIGVRTPAPAQCTELRRTTVDGIRIRALVMRIQDGLSIPAYLLHPAGTEVAPNGRVVLALHGHGAVESCLGVDGVPEDYHHNVAFALAEQGFSVLCPELRGFGALSDLAAHTDGSSLDYWRWGRHMTYTLLTDGLLRGRSLVGDTVEDLLRWEECLAKEYGVRQIDVAGISWGGDLACTYPIFSNRVRSIFASGTLGSFAAIYRDCGNAPAHCIPGVLNWFDRADIAALNAPVPILVHYGELDTPGPDNGSGSYNSTVPRAFRELREAYSASGAAAAVSMRVSPGLGHEMDIAMLVDFLS